MAGIECLRGRGPESQLGRREVPVTSWARSPLGPQDAVLFEIANHSWRAAKPLRRPADPQRLTACSAAMWLVHEPNLPRSCQIATPQPGVSWPYDSLVRAAITDRSPWLSAAAV